VVAHGRCVAVDETAVRAALAEQAARRAPGQHESAAVLDAMGRMRDVHRSLHPSDGVPAG
jgi:hypothetical protein